MVLKISSLLCSKNHHCVIMRVCKVDAISQENNYTLPILDNDKCVECGECVKVCPMGAVIEIKNKK